MLKSLLLVLGLGFAGIDPLGLSILVAAIAAGARKPHVIAFCAASLVGIAAIGAVFWVFGKQVADQINALVPDLNDPVWAVIELCVAALIFYWLVSHYTASEDAKAPTPAKLPQRMSVFGMVVAGLAFSGATALDPTFFATAAIASQAKTVFVAIALFIVWLLVSQSLLFAFALAYLFDAHQPLIDFVKPMWEKVEKPVIRLFYMALFALAVGLTVDALTMFATGSYLITL